MSLTDKLDKAIATLAPKTAYKRAVYRAGMAMLDNNSLPPTAPTPIGSKRGFRAWRVPNTDADSSILPVLEDTRARSRDLCDSNPLARGAVSTLVTNVIGSGLALHPHVDRDVLGWSEAQADEWEKQVLREWNLWAGSTYCDSTLHSNFSRLQTLIYFSSLVSGEVFILMPWKRRKGSPYDLRVQVVEADRVVQPFSQPQTTRFAGGIEIDADGAPVAYHFAKVHPGNLLDFSFNNETQRIPAFGAATGRRNVLHIFDRERPEQRRGKSYLAPVIEPLKQLGRYTDAELMAAVVSSMLTIFVKRENPDDGDMLETPFNPDEQVSANDPHAYELGNGAIVGMAPGESIEVVNPQRPNVNFDPFWLAMVRQVATGLNQSFEVILKHFSASYSASRGALLEAWRVFHTRRDWFDSDVCQPIYEEFLTEAVIKGRISAPGFLTDPIIKAAYAGSEWVGPAQGQIDQLKEVEAAEKRVQGGFSTREREAREITGMSFHSINRQRTKEEDMRRDGKWAADTQNVAETREVNENAQKDTENG